MTAADALVARIRAIVGESPTIAAAYGLTEALRRYDEPHKEDAPLSTESEAGIAERFGFAEAVVSRSERLFPREHVVHLVALAYGAGAWRLNRPDAGS